MIPLLILSFAFTASVASATVWLLRRIAQQPISRRAKILCALFNSAQCVGLGFFEHKIRIMSELEAEKLLEKQTYFDYIEGRVMKVSIGVDCHVDTRLYNRDNGYLAAERAIESIN